MGFFSTPRVLVASTVDTLVLLYPVLEYVFSRNVLPYLRGVLL
jgi:hypothetical protein